MGTRSEQTPVAIYDTTLRDGTQTESLSLSLHDKLKIIRYLDSFGIPYIECGWPGSNPKDAEVFDRVKTMTLTNAKICAFGSTRRKGISCDDDGNCKALVAAQTPVVTLVGKSWDLHVHQVLETSLEENLSMIADTVRYFKQLGREVVFDAEHFVDGFKANKEYALKTAEVAAQAGADFVVVCDTNGGSLPWQVAEVIQQVAARVSVPLGIHTHDDGGCAVANSLAAVDAGCRMVQGTINGYGERVGNANLSTIIPDIQLKMDRRCVADDQLGNLTELSRYVAEVANLELFERAPFVGRSAFAHKGGIHVAAMLKADVSYQHIDPKLVGNSMRCLVSELSGRGNITHLAGQRGFEADHGETSQVLNQIKELENNGYCFESAEATVELMLRRSEKGYRPPFELIDYLVIVEQREGRGLLSEAMVKVKVNDQVYHCVADGNGPVHALSLALRRGLVGEYPQISEIKLTDYKVRIIDTEQGTAANVRVLIDFSQGAETWTTVGANTNIIEASWVALADAFEYALLPSNGAMTEQGPQVASQS